MFFTFLIAIPCIFYTLYLCFKVFYIFSPVSCIVVSGAFLLGLGFCLYRKPKATLITLGWLFIGTVLLFSAILAHGERMRNSPRHLEYWAKKIEPGMKAAEVKALIPEHFHNGAAAPPYRARTSTVLNPAKPPIAHSQCYVSLDLGMFSLCVLFDESDTVVGYLFEQYDVTGYADIIELPRIPD